ncbi:MAG: helix-turn-helix domain-containing protein [Chitinophagales bacterium]|nr:helix-turn-helix domain-containing protein [Chitinophagales bacterium]
MAPVESNLQVICLESEAFYQLIDQVIARLEKNTAPTPDQWISDQEAMQLLRITSKTTLQKYRDEGKIRFSQPSRKVILYDRASILEFIDTHSKDTFS